MKGKTIEESSVVTVQQMSQADANLSGNVHGGIIMKLIDTSAGIVARRHSANSVVTASIERLDFHNPVYVGDLLMISASINFVGNTSMEIGARVEAEDIKTGKRRHTASAYLTFVALDSEGKPTSVPPLVLLNDEEKRRFSEAEKRHITRREERKREERSQM